MKINTREISLKAYTKTYYSTNRYDFQLIRDSGKTHFLNKAKLLFILDVLFTNLYSYLCYRIELNYS